MRRRIALSLFAGIMAALVNYRAEAATDVPGWDFAQQWIAANLLRMGQNPYLRAPFLVPQPRDFPASYNYWFYPLPSALLVWPLSFLPVITAAMVFTGLAVAVLVFAISAPERRHLWPVLMSAPLIFSVKLAQWSPWIFAAALLPALGPLLVVKPTIGVALWLYRPNRWAVIGAGALALAGLVLLPTWPLDWLRTIAKAHHAMPISVLPLGPLVLLALLKWRDPRARLLVAMSLVPQLGFSYDQLPLFLVCRTRREALALTSVSWFGWFGAAAAVSFGPYDDQRWALPIYYATALAILFSPEIRVIGHKLRRPTAFQLRASAARAGMSPPVQPQ